MISCNVKSTVTNPVTNNEEESRLFNDLLSFAKKFPDRRNKIVDIYLKVISPANLDVLKENMELNEQGEPNIGDLLRVTDLAEYIDEESIQKYLKQQLNVGKQVDDTTENYTAMVEKIIKFNDYNSLRGNYIAILNHITTEKGRKLYITAEPYSESTRKIADDFKRAYNLNNKIKDVLQKAGISIYAYDSLQDELATGEIDFKAAVDGATGLKTIIKIAKGSKGKQSLPEEFSHFVYECLKNEELAKRLVNIISNNNLEEAILGDEYDLNYEKYNGDKEALTHEAITSLIRQYFLENEGIVPDNVKSLSERLKKVFKQKFSRLDENEIQKLVDEAITSIQKISSGVFTDPDRLSSDLIKINKTLFHLDERVNRDIKLLQKIINTEIKRASIYDTYANKKFIDKEKEFIAKLEKYQKTEDQRQALGIAMFVQKALGTFKSLSDKIKQIKDNPNMSINEKCKVLREVKSYLASYTNVLEDIRRAANQEAESTDSNYNIDTNFFKGEIKTIVDNAFIAANDLEIAYDESAKPLFMAFMKPFMGEEIVVPFGKNKGEKMSVDRFVNEAVTDISFLDRWLNSMTNSGDWMNKLFAVAVKQQNTKTRLETIDYQKKLIAAGLKLEKAGITDQSFVFERDNEDNLTLNFVSKYNWGQYRIDKNKFEQSFNDKFGEDRSKWTKAQRKERNAAVKEWNRKHLQKDKETKYNVPSDMYLNPEYDRIQNNKAMKEFYDTMLEMKQLFDSWLPNTKQQAYTVPVIMKDLVERVKDASNLRGAGIAVLESLRDEVIRRSDDVDFGMEGETVYGDSFIKKRLAFDSTPINRLPIYYQKLRGDTFTKSGRLIQRGDNVNDVSTDIVSTMSAYAYMAVNYKNMNDIVDALEVARDFLDRNQEVQISEGGKPVVEKIKFMGREFEQKALKQSGTRISQQRDDFFSAQVYGRYFADAGTITILGQTFDLSKLADLSNKLTSLNGLALNFLAGFANVNQGVIMMDIDAKAKEFFNTKNVAKGDLAYAKYLPDYMLEIGSRAKKSMMALFDDEYNIMQEYDRKIRDIRFDRRQWFQKMFGSDFLYFTTNSGEHWMQHRTFFSLVDAEPLTDENGNEILITDAYDRKFIQEDGSLGDTDQGLGAKLVMKTGLHDRNGNRIITREESKDHGAIKENEISQEEFTNYFSRKVSEINHRLHGIYNTEDMNAFQRTAIGRMAMIFRKWIVPAVNRRYRGIDYNFDLDEWTEGYYHTVGRLMGQIYYDIRNGEFNWELFKDELTDTEKANVRRAMTEMAILGAIVLALMIIDWDDNKDKPWAIKMMEYQLRRMRTEVGAIAPTLLLPNELFKIIQSPTADVRTWQAIIDTFKLLNPANYSTEEEDLIRSGRYKGHTKAYKIFYQSPLFPFNNDWYNMLHPEETIPFYKR